MQYNVLFLSAKDWFGDVTAVNVRNKTETTPTTSHLLPLAVKWTPSIFGSLMRDYYSVRQANNCNTKVWNNYSRNWIRIYCCPYYSPGELCIDLAVKGLGYYTFALYHNQDQDGLPEFYPRNSLYVDGCCGVGFGDSASMWWVNYYSVEVLTLESWFTNCLHNITTPPVRSVFHFVLIIPITSDLFRVIYVQKPACKLKKQDICAPYIVLFWLLYPDLRSNKGNKISQ